MRNKKGQMIPLLIGIFVVVVLAGVTISAFTGGGALAGLFSLAGDGDGVEAADTAADLAACDGIQKIAMRYNDRDIQLAGSDPSSSLRIVTDDLGFVADDGTIDLTPKRDYIGLAGNGSTTYYAKFVSWRTGCSDFTLKENGDNVGLANIGTITTVVKNSENGNSNSVSDRQDLGQSDVDTEVTIKYDVNANNYWGNPNIAPAINVITCQFDKSDILNIKVDGAAGASKPNVFAFSVSPNVGGAGADAYDGDNSYIVPSLIDGSDNTLTLLIDTVSGSNPGNGNFTCNFYDANLDLDETDLTLLQGTEDEDSNVIFLKNFNVTVHYE